jgi:hypothetical protein
MRGLQLLCASVALAVLSSASAFAQGRRVAITVDDLPYAGGTATRQKPCFFHCRSANLYPWQSLIPTAAGGNHTKTLPIFERIGC